MSTDQPAPDALRQMAFAAWAGAAPEWERRADDVDEAEAPVTALLVRRLAPGPGDRVLELACGPGGLGLAVAPLVGPEGEVVCSDLVPEMAAAAAARATARGLRQVTTAVLDLEAIDVPDAGFDGVVCREGLMLAADPARAVRETARVLRPGGRVALAVWGPRDRNPWLGWVLDAAGEQLGTEVPPPGVPGPFSLADRELLGSLLRDAGLADVVVEDCEVRSRHVDAAAWFERTTTLAGPLGQLVAGLPEASRAAMVERLRQLADGHRDGDGMDLPGLALVVSGRRPED